MTTTIYYIVPAGAPPGLPFDEEGKCTIHQHEGDAMHFRSVEDVFERGKHEVRAATVEVAE